MAFERQEVPPSYILADYWEAPGDMSLGMGPEGEGPDRRGLTGSARLLQDIFQLDQYAFKTDQRKLQLTKTISLAQRAPAEFERFRTTGVLPFGTPQEVKEDVSQMGKELIVTEELEFENEDILNVLRDLLKKSKIKHKEVLYMRYFERLSNGEIAKRLNLPKERVAERINYAKKKLIELCKKENIFQ